MYSIDGSVIYKTFNEINRVLFFNQLRAEEAVIMVDASLDTEYSYCYREIDGMIYLGLVDSFKKESHFRYIMMLEMIRLYQYQVQNKEPTYNETFKTFHNAALKKFKDTMKDPHEDIELSNS